MRIVNLSDKNIEREVQQCIILKQKSNAKA
jgi:hypothetical protein|uniref:Uncharacterized protein n=1 Tax=Bacteriophage sp. TaxID=38018 RepID=A0A8D9PEH6_9VIRU|nr:MAG TPA: hypothetical protein [Bacteriophage sp.]